MQSGTLFAASSAMQGVNAFAGAGAQASAMRSKAEYDANTFEINRRLAEFEAEDAIRRGGRAANQKKKETKQVIGSQRAALAAQGIEIDSGSAADIQESTAAIGAMDAITIKNNAYREAYGLKTQALNFGSQAAFSRISGEASARNTLLAGGISALGYGFQTTGALSERFGGGGGGLSGPAFNSKAAYGSSYGKKQKLSGE